VVLAGLTALQSGQRRWLILAGVLAASAALFKQSDLASLGAVSLVLVALGRWRDLVWLWVALVCVLASAWASFAALGGGGPFVEATLGYNLARFGFQSQRIPLAALTSAWQVFRDGMALLWLLALVGIPIAWSERRWRVLLVWAACDTLALFLGGIKFTREYFVQLVPSFALLAAAGLQALWTTQAHQRLGRAWLVLSLAAIALLSSSFQSSFTLRAWNDYIAFGWSTTSVERLASMIASLPADETVFVWGDEAQLYALAGRLPPTRFLNLTGLEATGDPAAAARRAELIARLVSRPPAVIVVDRRSADDDPDARLQTNVRSLPELERLLSERYRSMDPSVLRPYIGGGREEVFVRQGGPDLCQQMAGCRLS
jgi:hypothetical protein